MTTETVYNLSGTINEVTFKKRTKDIAKTLLELKPEFVFTDTYITLSTGAGKNKVTTERKVNLVQSKRLFNNEDALSIFVMNLTQEYQ